MLTGDRSSYLENLRVPAVDTAIIQEIHMIMIPILCDIVEPNSLELKESRSDKT